MAQVQFGTAVGGDDTIISDDNNAATGLGNGGHRTRLIVLCQQLVAVAAFVVSKAAEAASSALTALNAPGTTATSTTSNDITGAVGTTKTWTIQAGKTIVPGMRFKCARTSAPATQSMEGTVVSYSGTTLQVAIDTITGTGTGITDWTFSLTASGGIPSSRTISAAGLATGGGDLSANRTITVTAASTAETRAAAATNRALIPQNLQNMAARITLTDAATVAWDTNNGHYAGVTLGGNRQIGAPTNLKDGWVYTLDLVQDGTGSRVPTWDAVWDFGAAGTPILQTAAGKSDKVTAQYNAARAKLEAVFRKGA